LLADHFMVEAEYVRPKEALRRAVMMLRGWLQRVMHVPASQEKPGGEDAGALRSGPIHY
jgi:hypothetical protein